MISILRKYFLIRLAVQTSTAIVEDLLSQSDTFCRLVFYTQHLEEEEIQYVKRQMKNLLQDYLKYIYISVDSNKIEAGLSVVPTSFRTLPPVDEEQDTEVYLFEKE